jgi:succinate dehydrogenase/fumarate reductase cytochrome b subunit
MHPRQLPATQRGEGGDGDQRQQPTHHEVAADRAHAAPPDSLKTLLIVGVLLLILWNLGAGLYYMLVDKGQTKRTVNSLTRRIALSVGLILFVVLAIKMGWITPHGIGSNPN